MSDTEPSTWKSDVSCSPSRRQSMTPPLEKALTTPEVIARSVPGSSVRFLKMGTVTVLM